MKKSILTLAALFFASAIAAHAGTVTLTFTGLQNTEAIDNFYNGGTGGNGSTGGPNYGISFSSDSLAIISNKDGGTGNFSDVPPPATNTIAFFLNGPGDVMDVAAGFNTGFSFYYASTEPGSVQVWSGLDGTGTLLATDALPTTPSNCDPTETYSCWVNSGVAFGGSAESVIFSGAANFIGFADITLGASAVPPAVPEPSNLILAGSGLLSVIGAFRRRIFKA
jgi:hypothetical protein